MPTQPSQWDAKYVREYPFMAFGSIINAYKETDLCKKAESVDAMLKDIDKLFLKAMSLTELSYKNSEQFQNKSAKVDF